MEIEGGVEIKYNEKRKWNGERSGHKVEWSRMTKQEREVKWTGKVRVDRK